MLIFKVLHATLDHQLSHHESRVLHSRPFLVAFSFAEIYQS